MAALYISGAIALTLILRGLNVAAPAGIRRNNPGNLRPLTQGKWEGQSGEQNGFAVFSTSLWGLRALARNLRNYGKNHGINSFDGVAQRWAPPSENDSKVYALGLSNTAGIALSTPINLTDPKTHLSIMRGIVRNENGQKFPGIDWYSDAELSNAQALAGIL